jgi:hypothetical protein
VQAQADLTKSFKKCKKGSLLEAEKCIDCLLIQAKKCANQHVVVQVELPDMPIQVPVMPSAMSPSDHWQMSL